MVKVEEIPIPKIQEIVHTWDAAKIHSFYQEVRLCGMNSNEPVKAFREVFEAFNRSDGLS